MARNLDHWWKWKMSSMLSILYYKKCWKFWKFRFVYLIWNWIFFIPITMDIRHELILHYIRYKCFHFFNESIFLSFNIKITSRYSEFKGSQIIFFKMSINRLLWWAYLFVLCETLWNIHGYVHNDVANSDPKSFFLYEVTMNQ